MLLSKYPCCRQEESANLMRDIVHCSYILCTLRELDKESIVVIKNRGFRTVVSYCLGKDGSLTKIFKGAFSMAQNRLVGPY